MVIIIIGHPCKIPDTTVPTIYKNTVTTTDVSQNTMFNDDDITVIVNQIKYEEPVLIDENEHDYINHNVIQTYKSFIPEMSHMYFRNKQPGRTTSIADKPP